MSLRPTQQNNHFGIYLSAEAWAMSAIGADKRSGEYGFEDFCSGDWKHHWHYKHISNGKPEYSPSSALDEMAEYRLKLAEDIVEHAKELDEMVMRLQRMEEQMQTVGNI